MGILLPHMRLRVLWDIISTLFIVAGWTSVVLLSWKLLNTKSDNKVYDPFEILGIRSGSTEKEIKKHYKRLSLKLCVVLTETRVEVAYLVYHSHPDKVKLAVNQTIEEVSSHFVDLTKAYKSYVSDMNGISAQWANSMSG